MTGLHLWLRLHRKCLGYLVPKVINITWTSRTRKAYASSADSANSTGDTLDALYLHSSASTNPRETRNLLQWRQPHRKFLECLVYLEPAAISIVSSTRVPVAHSSSTDGTRNALDTLNTLYLIAVSLARISEPERLIPVAPTRPEIPWMPCGWDC